jgi:hypothetical protein
MMVAAARALAGVVSAAEPGLAAGISNWHQLQSGDAEF